jgi:2,3-bisphosphoglycerate-independent phosphoglycerate mutase
VRLVLLLFIDGVGLGDDDAATNAFALASLPVLTGLLDGRRVVGATAPFHGTAASLVGLDATLRVDGLPQSGTGQTTLFTGVDAVRMHGRHFGPWVPVGLRPLLLEQSVLARAAAAGKRVTFANAYPEELVEAGRVALAAGGRRMPPYLRAGPPLAALGAGVLNRHTPELERDDAVASEITNDGWREHLRRTGVPIRTAAEAGATLAHIAAAHDLTLFAHYATDTAGHRGGLAGAIAALERVDAFLGGLLAAAPPELRIVVTSDHGNIEDCTVGHTRNPAVCLVLGSGHAAFAAELRSLLDVTPAILRELGATPVA